MRHWRSELRRAKATAARRDAEEYQRYSEKWWNRRIWLRSADPLVRYTGWLVFWTALLFIAAVGAAVISLFALFDIAAQLDVMRGQQKLMAGQLDAMQESRRPWIAFDAKLQEIRFAPGGTVTYKIAVAIQNLGDSTAKTVTVQSDLKVLALENHLDRGGTPRQICDRVERESLQLERPRFVLGPREAQEIEVGGMAIIPEKPLFGQHDFAIPITVCVRYTYADGRIGQVGTRYWVRSDRVRNPNPKDPKNLSIVRDRSSGEYSE